MRFNAALARRVALILGLSFPAFSNALADGRAVLPPKWMVEAYLSDALVKPSRDDIARAIIPGLGMVPAFISGAASDPPIYVGTGTKADGWSGPTSAALPSGWQSGDLHLLFLALGASSGDPRVSTPSGWTSQYSDLLNTLSGYNVSLQVFSRIAQSGDGAVSGILVTVGVAYVVGYRGANASSPVEAAAGAKTQTGAASYGYQNITTLGINRRVVEAFVAYRATASATTGTPDASFTSRADGASVAPLDSVSVQIEDKVLPTAGAVGSLTHGFSATTGGHLRAALAILPA